MISLARLPIFILYLSSVHAAQQVNIDELPRESEDVINYSISDLYPLETASLFADTRSTNRTTSRHLIVVTLESPPFVMKEPMTSGNSSSHWSGYCLDFFHELIKHLPYPVTYEIYQVADNKFGSKTKKIIMEKSADGKLINRKKVETWNGLIGDLERKKADLALAPMAVMAERELVVDFTIPFYDLVGIQILLKKPEVSRDWFKFLTVLDNEVWFSITLAYFVTSFVIFLFDRLSPYSHKNLIHVQDSLNNGGQNLSVDYLKAIGKSKDSIDLTSESGQSPVIDNEDGKPDFGIKDSLWFCITSLTPQGGGEAPQNLSGRIVAGAWWLFCFIVISSYTANLAAFLTVSRLDIPIESLDDLSKQYRIKYAPIDGTAESTYFERMAYIEEVFYNIWKEMSLNDTLSEDERSKFAVWDYPISDKYTKIWAEIQEVGMPSDTEAGLRRVKTSNMDDAFALLADANLIKHATMTDCSLRAVGDEFSRKPIALAVRRGEEQLRDDLSYAILQLINQRYMEVLREKWWTNNPAKVVCDNADESEGISIENIGGVFIIIFAGVVLSFLVWAIERYIYKTKVEVSRELIERL